MKQPRHNVMIENLCWETRPIIRYDQPLDEEYMDDNRYDYIDSGKALANFVRNHAPELDEYVQYHHTVEGDNFFAVPISVLTGMGAKFDDKFAAHVNRFPELRLEDGSIIEFNLDNGTVTLFL